MRIFTRRLHKQAGQIEAVIDTVKGPSDRAFGMAFTVLFAIIGISRLWHHLVRSHPLGGGMVRPGVLAVAGALLTLSLVAPGVLHPANRAWAKLAFEAHRVTSGVATGAVFFLIATPAGILMRLFGKDPLKLRFDPCAESYWCRRNPPGPDPGTMSNQF